MKQKSAHIETLRGLMIIFIVMGHVIGNHAGAAMNVPDDSFWRYLYYMIDQINIPIYTLIAGWVYSLRPITETVLFPKFIRHKAVRLLVPMLVVGGSYFALKSFIPGETEQIQNIWKLLIFPYNLYWYLSAIFWTFAIVSLFDAFKLLDKIQNFIIFFVITVLLYKYETYIIPEEVPNYFSFKGAIYLLPFFTLGVGIQRFKSFFSQKNIVRTLYGILIAGYVVLHLIWFQVIGDGTNMCPEKSWLTILTGLAACVFLLGDSYSTFLVRIGSYAYTIYLYHSLAKGFSQSILERVGVSNDIIIFTCGFIIGIAIPILIDIILSKYGITRYLFLGKRYK